MNSRSRLLSKAGLVGLLVLGTSAVSVSPAMAEIPEGWSNPDPVDPMHTLLVLIGIPLLVIALVYAAIYLPGVVRGDRGSGTTTHDEWFGGSGKKPAELESTSDEHTGGSSGAW